MANNLYATSHGVNEHTVKFMLQLNPYKMRLITAPVSRGIYKMGSVFCVLL